MEKGDPEPQDEGLPEKVPPDEQAILRYEEHITELMVTVAHLHGQIEHLQQRKNREEEEFFDLCSEYTASLPRCPVPFPSMAAIPPSSSHPGEGNPDLFLAVHQAVTSLENTVVTHRSRIPSTETKMEEPVHVAESFEESLKKFDRSFKELYLQTDDDPMGSDLGFLSGDTSIYEQEIALYEERNAALRGELGSRNEELSQSKETLHAYQEERDKLQRKVKDLQNTLSRVETLQSGASSPLCERDPWGFQGDFGLIRLPDPVAIVAQKFLRCVQDATNVLPTPGNFSPKVLPPAETHSKDPRGPQRDQFHRSIETLQGLNHLLLETFQETKSDTEGISMLLDLSESDNTALRLAVQYSERCLEAYEALFSLAVAKQGPCLQVPAKDVETSGAGKPNDLLDPMRSAMMEKACHFLQSCGTGGEMPGECKVHSEQSPMQPGEMAEEEDRKVLRDYIQHLRTEKASLKLPTHRPPPGPGSVAAEINLGIEARVAEIQRALHDALPSEMTPKKMEKAQLLRELQVAREALADLNTRLALAEKEKQQLELQTYTYWAQEAACQLMIKFLKAERGTLCGEQSISSGESSSSSSSDSEEYGPVTSSRRMVPGLLQAPSGKGAAPDPEAQRLELRDTLARNRELKDQIHYLLVDLEEQSQESRAQEMQEMELARDFFKAHSALMLAKQNARKKQEAQICQLESQMTLMSQRQTGQLRILMQTVQRLEGRVGGLAQVSHVGPDSSFCPFPKE
ncbi:Usher syndrome type-1C protein-binding protein 1 isoform X2 [Sceloporus undulatus]|uniref:Usher syndrome type-1C protein-binding protein 1 isoform X2 n=1 Tax=Sceloporus undulatus TaxID=8520 RepID=UPI001C4D8D99|nr:Usher syndrome type-1C protein-binding protein 1 isoform X2 [Sceloporus undulatus]